MDDATVRSRVVLVLTAVALVTLVVWNQARIDAWPLRNAFPRYISWCDRDYEGGSGTYDGDTTRYRTVAKTVGGGIVMAPSGPSCSTISPTVLLVEHDGEYKTYGLLGGP